MRSQHLESRGQINLQREAWDGGVLSFVKCDEKGGVILSGLCLLSLSLSGGAVEVIGRFFDNPWTGPEHGGLASWTCREALMVVLIQSAFAQ